MKRIFDLVLGVFFLSIFFIPMIIISLVIFLTSGGPILYWSKRVGKDNKIFSMPKFRSMKNKTPVVATHLLRNPEKYLTKTGILLRKSSLDELPQIWTIITGKMSFVGPRPALYNQIDLISLRTKKAIHILVPGLTGWAQINGRDNLSINEKINFDEYYKNKKSILFDIYIIFLTVIKLFKKHDISF